MIACPTRDEILPQALALLPRGRAWRTHEGGPEPGSILYQFWLAVAGVFEFVNARACALYAEFFCRTQVETNDLWLAEYGLPDACDPFPDLCAKVAAQGGARCADYEEAAARIGWSISCEIETDCAAQAGCLEAGCGVPGGGAAAGTIRFRVFLSQSPAYVAGDIGQPFAGCFQAGLPLACPPDISPLRCLLERIVHAHLRIVYEVIP